jgi:hypothetical protein
MSEGVRNLKNKGNTNNSNNEDVLNIIDLYAENLKINGNNLEFLKFQKI